MKPNTNALIYEGAVSLNIIDYKSKRLKKQINLHNEGNDTLFYFLCKCLAKQYDEQYAPLTIDASSNIYTPNNGNNFNSSLAYRIILSNQGVVKDLKINIVTDSEGEESNTITYSYATKFTAIIPYSALLVKDNPLKCIQLHSRLNQSDTIDSLLAWINIDGNGIQINEGEALLIEWNMGFKNPSTNTTSNNM